MAMSAAAMLRPSLGPIEPGVAYPIEDFKARSGFGTSALRAARRAGLEVLYLNGRAFIRGESFLDYLTKAGKTTK